MRRLLLPAVLATGCASYVGNAGSQAPGAPGGDDPDIAIERAPKKEVEQVIDPNAEQIDMGEEGVGSDTVATQPKRPSMPSMLPGVITGPGGASPITVSDDSDDDPE